MSHLNAVDNHKLMAAIKLWHECVQAVDGCYFDPTCRHPPLIPMPCPRPG